jgi:MscS family membrane protein
MHCIRWRTRMARPFVRRRVCLDIGPREIVIVSPAASTATLADSLVTTATTATISATTGTTSAVTVALDQAEKVIQDTGADWLVEPLFFGPKPWQCLAAFALIVLGFIVRRIVVTLLNRYARPAEGKKQRLDERVVTAAVAPAGFAVVLVGVLAALKVLVPPGGRIDEFGTNFLISTLYVTGAWLLFNLIDVASEYIERLTDRIDSRLDEQLVPIFRKSAKVFITVLAGLQVIDQMGADVKGLLAGLGLGGLAFALAARDSLANIFGSVVILADRPFRVGDWIEADGVEGTVEEIGFRSTRIRTFAKTLVTVPNSVVANWAVNNWSEMPIRRVKMTIGVSYEATPLQMDAAVEGIRGILGKHPLVHQDFYLVYFTDFGDSALEILLYYFTTTTVWAEYLQVRQEVNLSIMRLLDELGLEIAFPTRTVYLRQDEAPGLPARFRQEPD